MLYIEDRDQLLTVSMSQSLSPIQISFLFKEIRVSKQLVFIHQFGHIIWFVANLIVWCFIVANLIVWCFISILLIWIWIYSDSFKCLQLLFHSCSKYNYNINSFLTNFPTNSNCQQCWCDYWYCYDCTNEVISLSIYKIRIKKHVQNLKNLYLCVG